MNKAWAGNFLKKEKGRMVLLKNQIINLEFN